MRNVEWADALGEAYREALNYLAGTPEQPVGARVDAAEMLRRLGGPLPEQGADTRSVLAALAATATPGLTRSTSGRFFGFVIGGSMPAALGADWLTSAWDQNAGLAHLTPAAAAVEEVAGGWLKELFGLPAAASFGLVTGGQMANLTALLAARDEVLRRAGWDVSARGLRGAPPVRVLVGEHRHGTVDRAVRVLGLGDDAIVPVPADERGRMRPEAVTVDGPTIVCVQAGEINTGSFDPFEEIVGAARERGAWVHVDGAFGLWAAAAPARRHLLAGAERADSWATDAHKWLNVPYDCGLVFVADERAHRAALRMRSAYLAHGDEGVRDPMDMVPELSRRARGFPVYAALRALGRDGVAELIERSCALARRFAERLAAADGVRVLNDVPLNQVLVGFPGRDDAPAIIERVQAEGTCWPSGTTWQGEQAMRISVTNWSTDEDDVDRSVAAILRELRR
ncbi:aspartate aminotransferase family protein [Actinoplanes sp. TBRC 11911]|uniref:pyridoxal phosphate-dependent decarboxylase family protein n=1 Tax=Actinoplanes sp. TBRC 11911 TaxID=2729386 RepID=UPI00145DE8E6|nr:pyridoxal-dependent decarboxylase [Actinoplanes sp. TBRC 11911]NMO52424.1 aspartate aminotransferase family protein [Actinoplanes sp. TBRC 11911]